MRKFIQLLILAGTIAALWAGCKKDDSTNNGGNTKTVKRIQSINDSTFGTYTYEYNAQGGISSYSSDNGNIMYSYSASTITMTRYLNDGTDNIILTLNSDGYATTVNYPDATFSYEYNSEGYIIKSTYPSGAIEKYTYYNGNLTQSIMNSPSSASDTTLYEYYLDKENTIGNEFQGMSFYGKSSKNLVKKMIQLGHSNIADTPYTYEFDQDKYVTKKMVILDGVCYGSVSYTYTLCKIN